MSLSENLLPECRWRDKAVKNLHVCRSTKYVNSPNLIGADFCVTCPYVDHDPPPPLAPVLPCVHLGGATGAAVALNEQPGARRLPIRACAIHGHCVVAAVPTAMRADQADAIRGCGDCGDYLVRDPFGPDSAEMRRRADAFLAAVPDYPADRYRGRGVVIAGGARYFASLYVTIRALRHVGCHLPIQVWYLGREDEMPADRRAILAPCGVECVAADEVRLRHPARNLNGWELKVFATLHSPFEEILFLDADCYPCRKPDFLFRRRDYCALGAIFWSDSTFA